MEHRRREGWVTVPWQPQSLQQARRLQKGRLGTVVGPAGSMGGI